MLIRETLRQQAEQGIAEAMAGKFRLCLYTDDDRTKGMAVLFVPVGAIDATEAFVTEQCGGKPPNERRIIRLNPEQN